MNSTPDDLANQQQNLDNDPTQKNMTDQSDCNTSFQEQRQTELPDNELNIQRKGKKNTIHQYYKIRTDRYLNELKQKQTLQDASSQIFPDSANDSFQASNQDNSCNNSTLQISAQPKDFKRNDQRKPSTKQYYQKKVLGMIQDMSKRTNNYSYMKQENKEIKESQIENNEVSVDAELLKKNNFLDQNSNSINTQLKNPIAQKKEIQYASDQEKVIQKHFQILEKQKQQEKIQQELAEHQDKLVNKYHFLFFDQKGIVNGLSKSASSGKITDASRSFYSDENIKTQSHQRSLVFHESSFKKFQEDKAQLLEKHKRYVEQMKKLEQEIGRSSEKQQQDKSDQIKDQVTNEKQIKISSNIEFQETQEINLQNQNYEQSVFPTNMEDIVIETKELKNQEQQEYYETQLPQFQKQENEERIQNFPHPISEADLQSSDLQFQVSELKHRTNQKISAMKGNRRNQSQQRITQGEKSVQFPFQEELIEKEKRNDLILDSDEGIKLDLSKLGAINRKEMKKKRAETQSANSKRSIKSNWSTKTFKEKAEEVAGPAFGTALIGSLGVAITNKVLKGKQKLFGIVPALALGAYFYYKAKKENEIEEDDGYEEDIDDNDIDSDDQDEVISTNIKE